MSLPDYLDVAEKRIINAVLDRLKDFKGNVEVQGAGETDLDIAVDPFSARRAEIEISIAATDETTLILTDAEKDIHCYILFIHGNGEDVLADCGGAGPVGYEFINTICDSVLAAEGVL